MSHTTCRSGTAVVVIRYLSLGVLGTVVREAQIAGFNDPGTGMVAADAGYDGPNAGATASAIPEPSQIALPAAIWRRHSARA